MSKSLYYHRILNSRLIVKQFGNFWGYNTCNTSEDLPSIWQSNVLFRMKLQVYSLSFEDSSASVSLWWCMHSFWMVSSFIVSDDPFLFSSETQEHCKIQKDYPRDEKHNNPSDNWINNCVVFDAVAILLFHHLMATKPCIWSVMLLTTFAHFVPVLLIRDQFVKREFRISLCPIFFG